MIPRPFGAQKQAKETNIRHKIQNSNKEISSWMIPNQEDKKLKLKKKDIQDNA
jgi:hypothetical protein